MDVVEHQPGLVKLSWRGLRSLPIRLCYPPPAVAKVRSFGLTPVLDVQLDDVLDRKFLPPLSLKDFEEWLLFVEHAAQNLYFIFWLRDYTEKYNKWIASLRARDHKSKRPAPGMYRVAWSNPSPSSPTLAMFFTRARETFFVPGSPNQLSLPPHLLSTLKSSNPHPDPVALASIRFYVEDELRRSLHRCVRATFTNVGSFRAICGIIGGTVITLLGTVAPLAVNFSGGHDRWERLAILPGLWLGLTVLIASLNGVCMMIYIFGDFRQLRKFELARPPAMDLDEKTVSETFQLTVDSPAMPNQALTAPPKVTVRMPSVSASLFKKPQAPHSDPATSASHSETIAASQIFVSTCMKDNGAPHTLNASARSSLYGHDYDDLDAASESRSIPVYGSDAASLNLDGDRLSVMGDENGIYVSSAMHAEVASEDDPVVISTALAMLEQARLDAAAAATAAKQVAEKQIAIRPPLSAVCSLPSVDPSPSLPSSADFSQVPSLPFVPSPPPLLFPSQKQTASFIPSPYTKHRWKNYLDGTITVEEDPSLESCSFDFNGLPGKTGPSAVNESIPKIYFNREKFTDEEDDDYIVYPGWKPPPRRRPEPRTDVESISTYPSFNTSTPSPSLLSRFFFWVPRPRFIPSITISFSDCSNLPHPRPKPKRDLLPSHLHPSPFRPPDSHTCPCTQSREFQQRLNRDYMEPSWKSRYAREQRGPAFGPTTRILEPEVKRAHWEIVVRSAALAGLLCAGICAGVVAAPITGP